MACLSSLHQHCPELIATAVTMPAQRGIRDAWLSHRGAAWRREPFDGEFEHCCITRLPAASTKLSGAALRYSCYASISLARMPTSDAPSPGTATRLSSGPAVSSSPTAPGSAPGSTRRRLPRAAPKMTFCRGCTVRIDVAPGRLRSTPPSIIPMSKLAASTPEISDAPLKMADLRRRTRPVNRRRQPVPRRFRRRSRQVALRGPCRRRRPGRGP